MKLHWPTPLSLRHGSLRLRLLLSTLIWIAMAIAVAGWGLRDLFEKHIAQQLQNQLVHQLNQLSAAVNLSPEQTIEVQPIASDSRFATPLSGLYWQVDELPADAAPKLGVERSRSLWDQVLELPAHSARQSQPQGYAVLHLHALQGHTLLAVSRTLQLPEANAPLLRLTVAADQELLAEPLQRFTHMLLIALGLLAAGLVLAVVVQLQLALCPLQLLRQQLGTVRTGEATQLDGPFPHELQPLVSEFNHVLRANADIVQRARTQAGNLAHAVHTPLSILGNAAAQEDSPLALLVREQVATAQRQVDYHLARARAAAAVRATGLRTPVQQPLQALLRTMARLYPHIDFAQENDASQLAFKGEEQDLFEMLGNLLDNAGKWAHQQVSISVQPLQEQLQICIDDDGPGIADAQQRRQIFERGQRLDENRPGSGLGLHIVQELAHTYGGSVQALPSPLGGLRLELLLPLASESVNPKK